MFSSNKNSVLLCFAGGELVRRGRFPIEGNPERVGTALRGFVRTDRTTVQRCLANGQLGRFCDAGDNPHGRGLSQSEATEHIVGAWK